MTVTNDHFTKMADELLKYRERGFLCDTVIVAKCGTELRAHSVILAAVSPVFMTALEGSPSAGPHHLFFPEIELDVLQIAMHFIYTSKLLLPTIYSQMDQLSLLFNKLSGLGLDLHKLHGCEMTFIRKEKLQVVPKQQIPEVVNSGMEHNYHKTSSKETQRKRKLLKAASEERTNQIKSPGTRHDEVAIKDLEPDDAVTKLVKISREPKLTGLESLISAQSSQQSKKPGVSILRPLPSGLHKTAILPARGGMSTIGSVDVKELPVGLLQPVLDQNVGQILVLDTDNQMFWDAIMGENIQDGQGKQDLLRLIGGSIELSASAVSMGHANQDKGTGLADGVSEQTVYVCEFCKEPDGKEFKSEFDLSWHKIKFHWDQCHECSFCKRRFSTDESLRSHVKRHLRIRLRQRRKNFGCDQCGKHFETTKKLREHQVRHTGEKPYECAECGKHFTNVSNLDRHRLLHTGYRPFLCDLCGKGFVQKWSLMDHMTLHHEVFQEYECALCNCSMKSKAEMEKHALEIHQLSKLEELNAMIKKPEPYLCDLCGKNFNSSSSLRHHIRGHGNKPAKCDTCGKKFSTFYGLQLHEKLHTGERPFVCEVCQRGFIQKTSLITHVASHTGIKPFACVVCSKTFSSKGQLKQHTLMHSGEKAYTCGVCQKQFTYKSSLTLHNRTHTGDKPYVCMVCGSSYTQQHHLRGHLRTHTGEKPFVCEICSKSYKNKIDLRYHYTRFHKLDVKRVMLNKRSEYIFEIDRKVEVLEAPVADSSVSTFEEFGECEMKTELCK